MRLMVVVIALMLWVAAPTAQTTCNRACLTGFIDTYFKALVANDPSPVPLAANAKITSNARTIRLADAFWPAAERIVYRWDIVNERLGDTGTEAVVQNADGSKTMYMLRLKVQSGRITEVEAIKANQGDADGLWGPDTLADVSPYLQLTIREAEQDSYYGLIAAAEAYWRAFQTNGSPTYHPALLMPDMLRFENGLQTTGMVRNGAYVSAAEGFDAGRFSHRNIWDRRYPVVDTARGIVLSIVRFGLKTGMKSPNAMTANDRLVGEFFAVKNGRIQEVHAVLFNLPDSERRGGLRITFPAAAAARHRAFDRALLVIALWRAALSGEARRRAAADIGIIRRLRRRIASARARGATSTASTTSPARAMT